MQRFRCCDRPKTAANTNSQGKCKACVDAAKKRWLAKHPEERKEAATKHNRKVGHLEHGTEAERERRRAALHFGADHPAWKGDDVGYLGAHMRVRRQGSPGECYICETDRRLEVAFRWDTPEEFVKLGTGRFEGRMFSPHIEHYVWLCRPCHADYDGLGKR